MKIAKMEIGIIKRNMKKEISNVFAREILDSRGYPTVEVEVSLYDGSIGRASVPSGASVGRFEALELRDNDPNRYCGMGVLNAVNAVNVEVAKHLINMSAIEQEKIDEALIQIDGTANKSRIGANAILGVSLAVAKAAACALNISLFEYLSDIQVNGSFIMPVPLINVINGGVHASNMLNFQEFMIIPVGAGTFSEAMRMSAEVFHNLSKILKRKNYSTNVGDEGGFAPNISKTAEALDLILEAIKVSNYSDNFTLGLDVAASTFYENNLYKFENKELSSEELVDYYQELVNQYPILSIEDGLSEDDHYGWQLLTRKLGKKLQLVGDDLFATNCTLIKKGIEMNMANSVLIKPNQIGTLTETLNAIKMAHSHSYRTIMSHRSGETEDTTIAHLAVAFGCGQIKTGSLSRSERLAKYNELIRIEEQLGNAAQYYMFL